MGKDSRQPDVAREAVPEMRPTPAGKTAREFRVRLVAPDPGARRWLKNQLKADISHDKPHISVDFASNWDDVGGDSDESELYCMPVTAARIEDIPPAAPVRHGQAAKYMLFAEDLPIEAVVPRILRLGVRDPKRLHITKQKGWLAMADMLHRLILGLGEPQAPPRIVDAWIEKENLALLEPSFDRLHVPLEQLEPYIGTDPETVHAFELDEDGSFVYWPHADAYFGWEQCQELVDPLAALDAKQRARGFNADYGSAIEETRKAHGVRQKDVTGVTERHLRRVERGDVRASKAVLEALAQAHDLSLEEYLSEVAART
ncbi:MAG: helix-turn-helix transcriptional regulator [Candidatus Hydrogenedentota bacterium]